MLSVKLHKSKLYTAVAAVQYKNIKSGTSAAIDELPAIGLRAIHDKKQGELIDIRLRPGLAPPRGALYIVTLSPRMVIRANTAKRDVIHKTGST